MLHKLFRSKREAGFTITELLVAAVIFVLAMAIAVPLFVAQRTKIKEDKLKSDLLNAAISIDESKVDNGGKYPLNVPSSVQLTSDTATLRYTYPHDRLDYCLQIIDGESTYFKTSRNGEVSTTDCTFEYILPATKLTGVMKGFKPVLSWNTVANASKYVIYKNNIPVQTVNAGSSSAKTQSYTLPEMLPTEEASFHIIVGEGGTQSAQSNTVRLKAPVPAPTKPEIKVLSKEVKDSTTMDFTIGWNAVKYSKNYEIYDVTGSTPVKLATLNESAGSYTYSIPRGTNRKVMARSINDAGASGDSNILNLSTEWDTAQILSAESDPKTGKINFVFNEESKGKISPDWGYPDSKVRLKITEVSTGKLVYDKSNITSMTHETTTSFNRVLHRATIVVTTSTGETLSESAPVEINFPKPTKPSAVEDFTSTNGGTSPITPNKLKWSDVSCSVSSTPQYLITHDGFNSGWIESNTFNIPAEWLTEGSQETFSIVARCSNANGNSDNSAETKTTFTTGLSTPDSPKNLTVANRGNVASWSAVTCAKGSTAEYSLKQSIRNSDNQAFAYSPIKTNSYTLQGLVGGTDQNFSVASRCVQYDGAGSVKASSSWSAFTGFYSWTTKFEKPATPVIKQNNKDYTSSTNAAFSIGWTNDTWARSYEVFSLTTDRDGKEVSTSLGVFDGGAKSAVVNVKRGENMKVYAVASNPDYTSARSNILTLSDPWAKPKIIDYTADPYSGTLEVTWATVDQFGNVSPNFGDPDARYEIATVDTVNGSERNFDGIEGRSFLIPDEYVTRNPQTVNLIVTTSTGKVLTADPLVIEFPKPGPPKPPTNVKMTSSADAGDITPNRLTWTGVVCGKATPEYLITHESGEDSGWIKSQDGGNGTRYFDLPEEWLKQGFDTSVTIAARCTNPAGPSDASTSVKVSFRVNISTPDAVTGLTSDKIDSVEWDHATAPNGLSREYKVTTATLNGAVNTTSYTTENNRYTLNNLAPNKKQVVNVQVRFYNPANSASSAWSPVSNTEWVTPKPVPGTPTIKLASSSILNSTTQRYVVSWSATTWAEQYRVVNAETGDIMATVSGTTANIDLKRGIDPVGVYVEAVNTSATSPESNTVELYAPWSDPEFIDITANRDGTTTLKWQNGTQASPNPDWGSPDSKVDIEIRKSSASGEVVYSQSGLKTIDHTTSAFADTSVLRSATYYAKMTVTTSTGVTLNSGWQSFKFERPQAPARTVVNSDAKGNGTVKNDRLTWNAVTCSQDNAIPEYWVSSVPVGKTYRDSGTEKVTLMSWKADTTSFVIPQKYLVDMQGENVAFVVMTSCKFTDNGDYSYNDAIAYGDGYHEFTVGIAPPTKNPGTPTRASVYNDIVNWSAATCGTGTTPEYRVHHAVKNGATSSVTYIQDALSLDLPGTVEGENQGVKVQARCVKDTDATMMSAWGSYSAQYDYRSPLPKPSAPTITASGISYTSNTMAQRTVSWADVPNAETYVVYDGTTVLATLNSSTRSYVVPLTRGSSPARNITVKAGNFTYPVATTVASNKITMNAPWPNAAIKTSTADQDRKITTTWQTGAGTTRSPNWGNDASKVAVYITDLTTNKLVHSKTLLTTNSYVSPTITGTNQKYSVYIVVTTANGETLTSPKVNVTMNPPAPPKAVTNFKITNDATKPIGPNKLTWTAVTCPTTGSTPEYYIEHLDPDFGDYDSGWVTGTSYDVPQVWLDEGRTQDFSIVARCTSVAGESDSSAAVSLTSPRTNVVTPAAAKNFTVDSNKNNGTAVVSWDAITCPAHLQAGYMVAFTKKNDVAYPTYAESIKHHAYTNTSLNITGLTPNASHTAHVLVRCYDPADASGITSYWANSPESNKASWTTPVPAPAAPTLTVSNVKTNPSNEAQTQGTLTWNTPTWATKFYLYTSSGSLVGTYTGNSTTVNITRGTSQAYYVIAENIQGIKGAKSSNATVSSTWPALTLTQSGFNAKTGDWRGKWATSAQNPDWGKGAKFAVKVTNSSNGVVTNLTGLPYTTIDQLVSLPDGANQYEMVVTVTTPTNKVITSNSITVDYVSTTTIPTGLKEYSHNGVQWNAVKCASGATPSYWISWKRNGLTTASTYATTSTTYTNSTITPNTAQEVQVRAKCVSASYGDSEWTDFSPAIKFTSEYPIPTSVPAPTNVKLADGGSNKKTIHNRLTWSHVTCPTGSTRTYTVNNTHVSGQKYDEAGRTTPFFTKSGITANYYDLTAAQQQAGQRSSWSVTATCTVKLGSKDSSAVFTGWTTTPINKPTGAVGGSNNGWGTMTWNDVSCEAGTTKQYRFRVMWLNGVNVADYWTDWKNQGSNASAYMYTQWGAVYGLKQSVYVSNQCVYINNNGSKYESGGVNGTTQTWVPKVAPPTVSVKGSRSGKWTDITAKCSIGTDYSYFWTVSKEDDSGYFNSAYQIIDVGTRDEKPITIRKTWTYNGANWFNLTSQCVSQDKEVYSSIVHSDFKLP